jgi:hypothetical protein
MLDFAGFWQYAWKIAWAAEKSVEITVFFAYCHYLPVIPAFL